MIWHIGSIRDNDITRGEGDLFTASVAAVWKIFTRLSYIIRTRLIGNGVRSELQSTMEITMQ